MKFLIDMNMSPRWCDHFAGLGFYARHWIDTGKPDAPDHEIMRFARENNYIVITNDLDFGDMLRITRDVKPSVIQIRSSLLSVSAIGGDVAGLIAHYRSDLERGALIIIDPHKHRIRLLPLSSR